MSGFPPLYIDDILFHHIHWDYVEQRCQIRHLDTSYEVFWDSHERLPLVQFYGSYFHVRVRHINGTAISLRDTFRAMNIHNLEIIIIWPLNFEHHVQNILDTPVITAPVCQFIVS